MFDLFVVSMSLVALGPIDLPISILRLMRAFRIIRMFGRIKVPTPRTHAPMYD